LVAGQAEMKELTNSLILGHRRQDPVGAGKRRACGRRW
jgi:hypothetical protein